MKQKVYDSYPVPFSMTHDQYKTESRDQVYLFAERGKYIMLGEKYLSNDSLQDDYKNIYELFMGIINNSNLEELSPEDFNTLSQGSEAMDPVNLLDYTNLLSKIENIEKYNVNSDQLNEVRSLLGLMLEDIANTPLPIKAAIEFVKSDNPQTMLSVEDKIHFIPSRVLSIPIDKQNIIDNNVVPQEDYNKIVDKIEWKINRSYIQKNLLMIIDLIANNNWERPIYFATTIGRSNLFFLDEYLRLDGFAYKFVPIKSKNNITEMRNNNIGTVNTTILYDNLMNKFQWGRMNESDVYLDELNRDLQINIKSNFTRLANELILKNEFEKSEEVLDKAMEIMPFEVLPNNPYNLSVAKSYYLSGSFEKAEDLMKMIEVTVNQEINFYKNFRTTDTTYIYSEILKYETSLEVIRNIRELCGIKSIKISGTSSNVQPEKIAKEFHYEIIDYYKLSYAEKQKVIEIAEISLNSQLPLNNLDVEQRNVYLDMIGPENKELFDWFVSLSEYETELLFNFIRIDNSF